jgi:hypothetical protein
MAVSSRIDIPHKICGTGRMEYGLYVVCPELLVLPNDIYSFNVVIYAAFEVLMTVVMKSCIFWDVMQCSPLKVNDVLEEHIVSILRVDE